MEVTNGAFKYSSFEIFGSATTLPIINLISIRNHDFSIEIINNVF